MENRPLYRKLYADMIRDKYPECEALCKHYFKKQHWTALDVLEVNQLLFSKKKNKQGVSVDQKHRAYDEESIKQILLYQQKNGLNNSQIANKYGLSRNTISKWRRLFG